MLCAVKKKLNSQRGASLSIALLLFLVCLAVSSVVLTAGTAAAGRLSELKKMDQRYYSVTSAAELVRDLVTDAPVEFTQTKTTRTTATTDGSGAVSSVSAPPEVHTVTGDSLLSAATEKLIFGSGKDTMDAWLLTGADGTDGVVKDSFTMSPSNPNALDVEVKAEISNGDLVFFFRNVKQAEDEPQFCLKLTCTPDVPRADAADSSVTSSAAGNTVTTTEELTRKVSVNWNKENCVIERTGNWS